MRQLLFVVLMMVCSVSLAGWDLTGTTKDDAIKHYHDRSTVKKDGSVVKIWTMSDFSSIQINAFDKEYKSVKIYRAFDCKNKTFSMVSYAFFSGSLGRGDNVGSETYEKTNLKWHSVVPASLAEIEWTIACGKK